MLENKHRQQILYTFLVGIILVMLSMGLFWNAYLMQKESIGFLPILFAVLGFGSLSVMFHTFYKVTDFKIYTDHIEKIKSLERASVLEEMHKKEQEKNKKNQKVNDKTEDLAKQIIPAGKFKNIEGFGRKVLINLSNELNCVQGILYIGQKNGDEFSFTCGYALTEEQEPQGFKIGENLNGEVAESMQMLIVDEIPETYFSIESGLGAAKPGYLFIIPFVSDNKTIAVIELASFSQLEERNRKVLDKAVELLEPKFNSFVKA